MSAFASSRSFRMIAVRATFFGFPRAHMSWYLAVMSGLNLTAQWPKVVLFGALRLCARIAAATALHPRRSLSCGQSSERRLQGGHKPVKGGEVIMTISLPDHPIGDTFLYRLRGITIRTPDGVISNFTGWTALSQIRAIQGNWFADVSCDWVDATTGILSLDGGDTVNWPRGTAILDIAFITPEGHRASTNIYQIRFYRGPTREA